MKRCAWALALLLWFGLQLALAHDVQYVVGVGQAVTVTFSFAGKEAFSFEAYEIYREGEDVPFQVGRTDCHGRLVFLADRPGKWRIKAFSEDGHGADFLLTTDERSGVEGGPVQPTAGRKLRILTGVALIFGFFGAISLFVRRRSTKGNAE